MEFKPSKLCCQGGKEPKLGNSGFSLKPGVFDKSKFGMICSMISWKVSSTIQVEQSAQALGFWRNLNIFRSLSVGVALVKYFQLAAKLIFCLKKQFPFFVLFYRTLVHWSHYYCMTSPSLKNKMYKVLLLQVNKRYKEWSRFC